MGCRQSLSRVKVETPFTLKYHMIRNDEFKLGDGAFGVVYRAKVRQASDDNPQADVAVKCISNEDLKDSDREYIHQEVNILKRLKHPAIIQCLDFFEEAKESYIVTEIVLGGELFDRIIKYQHYSEKEARDLCARLLDSLAYMHEKGIAHVSNFFE